MLSNEEFKAGILSKVKQKEHLRKRRIKIISAVIIPCICIVTAFFVFATGNFDLSKSSSDNAAAENVNSVSDSETLADKSGNTNDITTFSEQDLQSDVPVLNEEADASDDVGTKFDSPNSKDDVSTDSGYSEDSIPQTDSAPLEDLTPSTDAGAHYPEYNSQTNMNPETDSLLSLSVSKYIGKPEKSVEIIGSKSQFDKVKTEFSKSVYEELSNRLTEEDIIFITLPSDSLYQATDIKTDSFFITVYLYKSDIPHQKGENHSLIFTSLPENKYHGQIIRFEFVN